VSVNGTLVEDKMRRFKGECAHFCFNNCFICPHYGASAKFSTNSHETVNSVQYIIPVNQFGYTPSGQIIDRSKSGTIAKILVFSSNDKRL
jgi:hypothetical protein